MIGRKRHIFCRAHRKIFGVIPKGASEALAAEELEQVGDAAGVAK